MKKPHLRTLNNLHKDAYDRVADEYEQRVEKLRAVTEKSLKVFSQHLPKRGKVLDIGCAVGYMMDILSRDGFIVDGIEISQKMASYAKKRNPDSKIIVGDFLTADFNTKYDGIVAFAFIHLLPKDYAVMSVKKMVSLLNNNGIIFLTTTKSKESSEGLEQKHDYLNQEVRFRKRWTQAEFEATIEELGLEVIEKIFPKDAFGKTWMDYVVRPK